MKKAYLQLHAAMVLAGFTGIFGRLITLNEGWIAWYRLLIAAIVMLLFAFITGRLRKVPAKDLYRLAISGSLLGLHWLFFYGSIKYANISVGVICFALTSFFNAILSPLWHRRRISIQELALSSLTLAGVALVFGFDSGYRTGILLGVVSSLVGAIYTLTNERLAQQYDSHTIMLYQMWGGWVGLSLVMPVFLWLVPAGSGIPSGTDLAWLLVLAVVCTVVMYGLITASMRHLSSFTVSLTYNLEPVYTIVLAILLYHENQELNGSFCMGLGFILLSVLWQMGRVKKQA
jgi:drug/metabolite transporter (DMT)-like permease